MAATGKVLILSRTNRAYGVGLQEFRRTLVAILANKLDVPIDQVAKSVMATSVHKSKGSEAHTVIVLEAEFGRIPMIHPDNTLLEMFGVTSESVLTDERRLFYVAITRARDRLFFLTERGSESPFLRYLDGTTQSGSPSPSVKSPVFGEFSMAIQKQMSTICGFDH